MIDSIASRIGFPLDAFICVGAKVYFSEIMLKSKVGKMYIQNIIIILWHIPVLGSVESSGI